MAPGKEDLLQTAIILDQLVETTWSSTNREYYERAGYGPYIWRGSLLVKARDLPPSSNVSIKVKCPNCNEIRISTVNSANRYGHTCCKRCAKELRWIDLSGKRYGRLIVLGLSHKNDLSESYWSCRCDCGTETVVSHSALRGGRTQSCGCYNREMSTLKNSGKNNHNFVDLEGRRFSRLTALEYLGGSKWKCVCECGNRTEVDSYELQSGGTQSCGCLIMERMCGADNPAYKPDLTDEDRLTAVRIRNSVESLEWRKSIYARDCYACIVCHDCAGGNLNAHHVFSFADYPEYRLNKDLGVTLCEDCHKHFHNEYGYGENNFNQFLTWIDSLGRNTVFLAN